MLDDGELVEVWRAVEGMADAVRGRRAAADPDGRAALARSSRPARAELVPGAHPAAGRAVQDR